MVSEHSLSPPSMVDSRFELRSRPVSSCFPIPPCRSTCTTQLVVGLAGRFLSSSPAPTRNRHRLRRYASQRRHQRRHERRHLLVYLDHRSIGRTPPKPTSSRELGHLATSVVEGFHSHLQRLPLALIHQHRSRQSRHLSLIEAV